MSFTKVGDAMPSVASLPNAKDHPIEHISDVKKHIVVLSAMMANLQNQIDALQADLAAFDPTIIRQVGVAGYPPANLTR